MGITLSGWQKKIFAFLSILFIFLFSFNPANLITKVRLPDELSYVSHGFSMGLDFNLKHKDMIATWKTQNERHPAHPIGPGLLAAPFIALFSIIDRLEDNFVIKNHQFYLSSWSFFGFAMASCFLFVATLFLYARGLEALKLKIHRFHLLFISSSFGILFYVLYRPYLGHSFEFFTLGLCFFASCQYVKNLREKNEISIHMIFLAALSIILCLQVRPSNIQIFFLPTVILGTQAITLTRPQIIKTLALFLLFSFLCFIPFGLMNYEMYHMIIPSSAAMYGKNAINNPIPPIHSLVDFFKFILALIVLSPQVLMVCFSSDFGLIFSSTLLFFGTLFLGYYLLKRPKSRYSFMIFLLFGIMVMMPMSIVLVSQDYGSIYAYRFLFCYFPVALLGYAIWIHRLDERYDYFYLSNKMAKGIQAVIFILCSYGLIGSIFFNISYKLSNQENINNFGRHAVTSGQFNLTLLDALFDADVYQKLLITRTPGFILLPPLDYLKNKFYSTKTSFIESSYDTISYELGKYYHIIPTAILTRVYVQILILGSFFIGSLMIFCRKDLT